VSEITGEDHTDKTDQYDARYDAQPWLEGAETELKKDKADVAVSDYQMRG
jgi:hypothetical protein